VPNHPCLCGTSSSDRRKGNPTTELLFGAGMPGLVAGAGPAFAPAPRAPDAPRPAPDRSVPALDALVAVPAGVYVLGEPGEERSVTLPSFLIGRWPVVNAHVRAFVEATGRPVGPALAARLADPQLADHPATDVTFADAVAFCAWAGARLPTGAEWAAAARGPDARPWPWGETFDEARCACVEAGAGWTVPVRAHPDGAAPCGAEQLAGNVWEWVDDPPDEDGWRTVRGGSYLDHAWGVRASRALPADPARATPTTGFRIARDASTRRQT
jgi:formylglycine-generating enzyme required for sulfatase activity